MILMILKTLAARAALANWVALFAVLSEVLESPIQSLNHVMSIKIDTVEITSKYMKNPPLYSGELHRPSSISTVKQNMQTILEMLK